MLVCVLGIGVDGFTDEAVHTTGWPPAIATTPCGLRATAFASITPRVSMQAADTLSVRVLAATV